MTIFYSQSHVVGDIAGLYSLADQTKVCSDKIYIIDTLLSMVIHDVFSVR